MCTCTKLMCKVLKVFVCVGQFLILQWSLQFFYTLYSLLNINSLFCFLFICLFCILSPNSSKMSPALALIWAGVSE